MYEHTRQCDKLYDMIDPDVLEWRRIQKLDKGDFIRDCQRVYELMGRESAIEYRVLKLEPWRSRKRGETIYSIKLVEKFRELGGKVFEVESICYAALKKGEWYLDHPQVQI